MKICKNYSDKTRIFMIVGYEPREEIDNTHRRSI